MLTARRAHCVLLSQDVAVPVEAVYAVNVEREILPEICSGPAISIGSVAFVSCFVCRVISYWGFAACCSFVLDGSRFRELVSKNCLLVLAKFAVSSLVRFIGLLVICSVMQVVKRSFVTCISCMCTAHWSHFGAPLCTGCQCVFWPVHHALCSFLCP